MKKLLILLGILLAVGALCFGAQFVRGPYSGAPSADSVFISWLSDPPASASIEIAPRDEYQATGEFQRIEPYVLPQTPSTDAFHLMIGDLARDTDYVYRVVLQDGAEQTESELGHFRTEPVPGEPIRFAVIADTQWQWEGENRLKIVNDAMASDDFDYDFVLHAGDLVESPARQYWDHWFDSFADLLLRAPLIPVLGNHEGNNRSYYENFNLPPGDGLRDERWWALHWGDLVVVGLDTNVTRATDIMAQQDWAREHLSGDEAYKVVMFHHPVYSSDSYHGNGYGYDKIYHPIFLECGVDLVINGHAHNYERIVVDGLTYLVVGGGGAVPRTFADELVPGSRVAIEGYNFYLRVTAAKGHIDAEVVSVARADDDSVERTNGELLDAFSIPERRILPPLWLVALGVAAAVLLLVRAIER